MLIHVLTFGVQAYLFRLARLGAYADMVTTEGFRSAARRYTASPVAAIILG